MVHEFEREITHVWDRIDHANRETGIDDRRNLIVEAIISLSRMLDLGCKDVLYPIGYAYYCHPDRRPGSTESELTERYLRRAISESVEPDLAWLFLAYHLHDLGQYKESNRTANSVDKDQLSDDLKVRCTELELCNNLLTCAASEFPHRLAEFARFISSLPVSDVPPLLLMNTLEALAKDGLQASCNAALEQLDTAYPVMSGHWFQNLASDSSQPSSSPPPPGTR